MTLPDLALLATAAVNVFLAMHASRSRRLAERAAAAAEGCLDLAKAYRERNEDRLREIVEEELIKILERETDGALAAMRTFGPTVKKMEDQAAQMEIILPMIERLVSQSKEH